VAAPTASAGAVELVKKEADEVITLYAHPGNLPFAVASSYERWYDLTDEEVKTYLKNGSF
jgi:predicted phosphoribosyltransferase